MIPGCENVVIVSIFLLCLSRNSMSRIMMMSSLSIQMALFQEFGATVSWIQDPLVLYKVVNLRHKSSVRLIMSGCENMLIVSSFLLW
jgi:hypothetical protein